MIFHPALQVEHEAVLTSVRHTALGLTCKNAFVCALTLTQKFVFTLMHASSKNPLVITWCLIQGSPLLFSLCVCVRARVCVHLIKNTRLTDREVSLHSLTRLGMGMMLLEIGTVFHSDSRQISHHLSPSKTNTGSPALGCRGWAAYPLWQPRDHRIDDTWQWNTAHETHQRDNALRFMRMPWAHHTWQWNSERLPKICLMRCVCQNSNNFFP